MGNSSCGCGDGPRKKPIIYDIRNERWANAVNNLSLAGVKMLHQQEPDLINEIVTSTGYIAIHISVKRKHFELFQYLLKYGGNINAICGYEGYSCLHLAVINKDIKIIRELFNADIDDTLINNNGKTAGDLITDTSFRRQYMRAKNNNRYHKTINQNTNSLKDTISNYSAPILKKTTTHLDTSIGGMLVSDLSNKELQSIMQDSNGDIENITTESDTSTSESITSITSIHNNLLHSNSHVQISENEKIYNEKYTEISARKPNIHLTKFGEQIGCEVDEIAYCLQTLKENNKLSKLWDKWVKKNKITKTHDLLKVIYGLTVLTLRNRRNNNIKPPSEPIKKLTTTIYKMLPKYKLSENEKIENGSNGKKRHVLTRKEFIANFHRYLYNVHEKFEKEENEI